MFAKTNAEWLARNSFSRKWEIESFRFNPSHILSLFMFKSDQQSSLSFQSTVRDILLSSI
jgi:hypothetical protein